MANVFNGVVAKVGVFPIDEKVKNMTVKKPGEHYGKQFNIDKTHSIAIKVVGLMVNGAEYERWISVRHQQFREGDELSLRIETGGEWKDVWEGSTLLFFYDINGEYVNLVDKGKMALLEQADRPDKVYTFGTKGDSGGATQSQGSFDPKGAMKGNAFNCAMILAAYDTTNTTIYDNMCKIYDINCSVQAKYPKTNGASVGMSITNSCHITKDITKVEEMAISLLNSYIQEISDYVDTGEKKGSEPQNPLPDDTMEDLPF